MSSSSSVASDANKDDRKKEIKYIQHLFSEQMQGFPLSKESVQMVARELDWLLWRKMSIKYHFCNIHNNIRSKIYGC